MVHIVIIAHSEIANSFAYCVEHILAKRVDNLHILAVKKTEDSEQILHRANEFIEQVIPRESILLLTDLFGATPSNLATKLIKPNKVEMLTGLNLPMLVRAISYAHEELGVCVSKALEGGKNGILHIHSETLS